MPPTPAADAIRHRLTRLWEQSGGDAEYRRVLRAVLSRLLAPPAGSKEGENGQSPLLLPLLCCHSLEDESQCAITVNAAWTLLYAAFYLLDKVEDREPAAAFLPSLGSGARINVTTGIMLGAQLLLARLEGEGLRSDTVRALRVRFNRMALDVCAGQHRDLTLQEPTLPEVWQVTMAKSGEFFALGSYAGARVATGDRELLAAYSSFGRHLGILIQIANDVNGLWSNGDCPSDLAAGRWSLPVAYAFHVLPPAKQTTLRTLLGAAACETPAEEEARRLILDCGALIYLTLEMEKHRRQAENILCAARGQPQAVEPLVRLLRALVTLGPEA